VECKGSPAPGHDDYLSGRRILSEGLKGHEQAADLVDGTFLAYNAARLREGLQLLTRRMLDTEVTVGMSLAGALTPAGLGPCCIVPLIEAGFVDWITSTGANLYHDLHFAFNCKLCAGDFRLDDGVLYAAGIVRIYDVLLSRDQCLLATDERLRGILLGPRFRKRMGTAELHHLLGEYAAAAEEEAGLPHVSVLAAAYRADVPVYTSSPGDSTIGLEVAATRFLGTDLVLDPTIDVNETAGLILAAKQPPRKSAVLLLGGGSPKNFMLQTVPHMTDTFGMEVKGHDYFFQVTDARPDTGGLSGATPQEAVSWGKVNPDRVVDSVVCYADVTLVLPILVSYALSRHAPRELKRLYRVREKAAADLRTAFLTYGKRRPR